MTASTSVEDWVDGCDSIQKGRRHCIVQRIMKQTELAITVHIDEAAL